MPSRKDAEPTEHITDNKVEKKAPALNQEKQKEAQTVNDKFIWGGLDRNQGSKLSNPRKEERGEKVLLQWSGTQRKGKNTSLRKGGGHVRQRKELLLKHGGLWNCTGWKCNKPAKRKTAQER